jgi:hypothetical protein
MMLDGSCHCGAVRFSVESYAPNPYMHCYCSICRKTAGGGGYAINIMGQTKTLVVQGRKNLRIYRARIRESERSKKGRLSTARRHFCRICGSALWIWDPQWRQWIYPFASAIDSPLPKPPERVHIMLDFASPWCRVPGGKREKHFPVYPEESIIDWHKRHGLYEKS